MTTLDEIEKRLEAATPGNRWVHIDETSGEWIVATDRHCGVVGPYNHDIAAFEREQDAQHAAHAPTDIAHLLRIARAAEKMAEEARAYGDIVRDPLLDARVAQRGRFVLAQAEQALREALEASNDQDA